MSKRIFQSVQFEFDEEKSDLNFKKHGIDFIEAQKLWSGMHVTIPAKHVKGENRSAIIGLINLRCYVAIFTIRIKKSELLAVIKLIKDGKGFFMPLAKSKKNKKNISSKQFDKIFEEGRDIFPYLDFDKAVVVKRVNVDFPSWMLDLLDCEAKKINISRQAVIKMWVHDRLKGQHQARAST